MADFKIAVYNNSHTVFIIITQTERIANEKIPKSVHKKGHPRLAYKAIKVNEVNFYSPKESSLKNSPRGPSGRVLSLPRIMSFKIFSPQRSMKFFFIP